LIIKVKGDTEKIGIRILGERISLVLQDATDVKAKLIQIIEDELKKEGDNLWSNSDSNWNMNMLKISIESKTCWKA